MALRNPVAIFTASSNHRAQALCHILVQQGIEAHVIEDLSIVGLWAGGTLPGVHTPKIWVDQEDAERAAAVLREHESREKELRQEGGPEDEVEALCEECGRRSWFPAVQRGSVQECPHCREYMDVEVGDEEE